MAQRRAYTFPRGWVASAADTALPDACSASSTEGAFAPAVAAGAPAVTADDLCTTTVLFELNATTYYGESVWLVGGAPELGSWNVRNAQALDAANYTEQRPLWMAEVALKAGEEVSYTYAKLQDCDQGYIYDTKNRTLMAPDCAGVLVMLTVDDAFEGPEGTSGKC